MINALRTLLLNRSGSDNPGFSYPGEEFVPPLYAAKSLPVALKLVHQCIFGLNPDRAQLNWRLRELLAILHTTPMVESVLELDPRVTYVPFASNLFTEVTAGPVIEPQGGTTALLYPLVNLEDVDDQVYYSWNITVVNGTDVSIQVLANPVLIPPPVTLNYTVSGGISSVVPLPSSQHSIRFQPTVGARWILTLLQPPARNLMEIYDNLKQGLLQDTANALFGVPPVEPYLSFKNLWELSPHPSWQLCGPVLALGYRINELG
jgi:hypothetical protein